MKSKIEKKKKIEKKYVKNRMFVGTSISDAFWKDFGRVSDSWKPRFSHFFDDFSKQILKAVSERPKKEKKVPKAVLQHVLGSARRNVRGPGER